jgi:hypothetical protein
MQGKGFERLDLILSLVKLLETYCPNENSFHRTFYRVVHQLWFK